MHIGVDGPDTVTVDARALDSRPTPRRWRSCARRFAPRDPSSRDSVRPDAPPGGCAIGAAVDLRLHGFEALGAEVHVTPEGTVIALPRDPADDSGAGVVTLRFPRWGATHAVVAAAALAEGGAPSSRA